MHLTYSRTYGTDCNAKYWYAQLYMKARRCSCAHLLRFVSKSFERFLLREERIKLVLPLPLEVDGVDQDHLGLVRQGPGHEQLLDAVACLRLHPFVDGYSVGRGTYVQWTQGQGSSVLVCECNRPSRLENPGTTGIRTHDRQVWSGCRLFNGARVVR